MTLIRGHGEPAELVVGNLGLSSVQGQPVFFGGGEGSSFKVGQRIAFIASLLLVSCA